MIDGFTLPLVVVTALGCGLMGGAFFAFSSFVMSGLKRLPTEQGIAAMQSINITAVTPAFMTALFATAAGCIAVVIAALVDWRQSVSIYLPRSSAAFTLSDALGLPASISRLMSLPLMR